MWDSTWFILDGAAVEYDVPFITYLIQYKASKLKGENLLSSVPCTSNYK